MKGLVSIIVPVYNSENYLEECITSILEQSYKNIELILINDGSDDESLKICKAFEERDERVRVIDKENAGVSAARNDGIAAARGMYVGFVDSDDTVKRDLYEKLVGLLSKDLSQCAVLSSYTINNDHERQTKKDGVVTNQEALGLLLELKFPTSLWAYLYKREVVQEISLKEDIHFFEDFEFNYRILKSCRLISLCSENLYYYRDNTSSINSQGANSKRLTCLLIPEYMRQDMKREKNRVGLRRLCYLESYFIVALLVVLRAPLTSYEQEYLKKVCSHIRRVWFRLILSTCTPLKSKVFILLAALDGRAAIFCWDLLRRSKH
ncbi:glycosyltransferase family 2 protein [Marinobacter sp. X15-166B]|uniref:glycosyltransferase family 2 protein n=1 Tax=Marinobacter sp. X15-166B TaxID=1897620 RepID=UPI000943DAB8|nr:glycosyltransferase [Marinobacter sp. X15-166B]